MDVAQLVSENTVVLDRSLARLMRPWVVWSGVQKYRRAFRNWREVLAVARHGGPWPVLGELRDGAKVRIDSEEACYAYGLARGGSSLPQGPTIVRFEAGLLELAFGSPASPRLLRVRGMRGNGDPGVFYDPVYTDLPVRGRTVVDVGANIGDSALQFAASGAAQVLAFEPQPESYALAEVNIRENGFGSIVRLDRRAVGARTGLLRGVPGSGTSARFAPGGIEGPETESISLADIVAQTGLQNGVLKMDCEGAEYDIVNSAPVEALRAFEHILIEYHYGSRSLLGKLREAGFRVALRPGRLPSWKPRTGQFLGYLRAERV